MEQGSTARGTVLLVEDVFKIIEGQQKTFFWPATTFFANSLKKFQHILEHLLRLVYKAN